jgi:hypothetical protein
VRRSPPKEITAASPVTYNSRLGRLPLFPRFFSLTAGEEFFIGAKRRFDLAIRCTALATWTCGRTAAHPCRFCSGYYSTTGLTIAVRIFSAFARETGIFCQLKIRSSALYPSQNYQHDYDEQHDP